MRKSIFLLFILICSLAFADDTKSLRFSAIVPEDFGIVYPEDALRLENLVFELVLERDEGNLISKNGIPEVEINGLENQFQVNLLYYGNSANEYNVTIAVDSNSGWVSRNNQGLMIPINVDFPEWVGNYGISAVSREYGSLDITVPPSGPKHAEKVGEMIISWESLSDWRPGDYDFVLTLSLRSRE